MFQTSRGWGGGKGRGSRHKHTMKPKKACVLLGIFLPGWQRSAPQLIQLGIFLPSANVLQRNNFHWTYIGVIPECRSPSPLHKVLEFLLFRLTQIFNIILLLRILDLRRYTQACLFLYVCTFTVIWFYLVCINLFHIFEV